MTLTRRFLKKRKKESNDSNALVKQSQLTSRGQKHPLFVVFGFFFVFLWQITVFISKAPNKIPPKKLLAIPLIVVICKLFAHCIVDIYVRIISTTVVASMF